MRFCIIKRQNGSKDMCICIEMYGVMRTSCIIGYQITRLELLHVPGSNARVKVSITFVLTEISS